MIRIRKLSLTLIQIMVMVIPLEISKLWFPFLLLEKPMDGRPVSLMDLARLTLFVLVIHYAMYILSSSRLPAAPYRLLVYPFLLLLVFIISSFTSPASANARNEVIRLAFNILIAIIFTWTVKEEQDVQRIMDAFRWITLILGGIVLIQALTGVYLWNFGLKEIQRYNATMADPNILARYMVMGFFAWFLSPTPRDLRHQIVRLIGITLCLVSILLSQSRGAWVLLILLFLVLELVVNTRQRLQIVPIVVFSALILFFTISQVPILRDRLQTFTLGSDVLGIRINYIQAGLAMFRDHPIFGVGLEGFPVQFVTNYREFLSGYGEAQNRSHTTLVTTAAELGIVGLVIYLVFLGQVYRLYRFVKRKYHHKSLEIHQASLIVFIGILAIFGSSQTEGNFWGDPYLWVFWGLLIAMTRLARKESQQPVPSPTLPHVLL